MGLDLVEFAMAIEEEFDLQIPDADAAQLRTLGDVYLYVRLHFGRKTNEPIDTWRRILELAAVQFGVPIESLTPQTSLLDLAPDG